MPLEMKEEGNWLNAPHTECAIRRKAEGTKLENQVMETETEGRKVDHCLVTVSVIFATIMREFEQFGEFLLMLRATVDDRGLSFLNSRGFENTID